VLNLWTDKLFLLDPPLLKTDLLLNRPHLRLKPILLRDVGKGRPQPRATAHINQVIADLPPEAQRFLLLISEVSVSPIKSELLVLEIARGQVRNHLLALINALLRLEARTLRELRLQRGQANTLLVDRLEFFALALLDHLNLVLASLVLFSQLLQACALELLHLLSLVALLLNVFRSYRARPLSGRFFVFGRQNKVGIAHLNVARCVLLEHGHPHAA
jgi:hypothetical protein